MSQDLKPCPFCGSTPDFPNGNGTQYEIHCDDCGQSVASIQICDLMTLEERKAEQFINYRYSEEYIERAKNEAIDRWNERIKPSFCDYCGGNDEDPQDHCMDCEKPKNLIRLTEEEFMKAIVDSASKPYEHIQRLTYDSGPYEVTNLTTVGRELLRTIMEMMEKKNSGEKEC